VFSFSNIFKGITRNVFVLGLVSLLTDASSQMVFPLIPLYLTSVLGVSAVLVGVVEGAAETTASLIKVFSGYWSDKLKKRKPFVLIGYSLSAITKPLFAFAVSWDFILFARVLERIGKGIRSAPRDAIVSESVDPSNSGKAYGFHRSMDGIGSMVGALLTFLLLPILGYEKLFLYAFIPGALAVFIILFVKEEKAESTPQSITIKRSYNELPIKVKRYIMIAGLFSLGHFGYAFILLSSHSVGISDSQSIMFYALFYLIYSLFSPVSGFLSDKYGKKRILIGGYLMFAIVATGLIIIPQGFLGSFTSIEYMVLIFSLYGVCYALIDGTQRAYIADMSPKHLKATALGAFHTAIGLVSLPGGFIAGWLWENYSHNATYSYGLSLSVLAVVFLLWRRK
jgi:MFS family permease